MLFVQDRRRNEGSCPPSLSKSVYFVAIGFCSIRRTMGDALFNERDALELEPLLCWQKKKNDLESCSFMSFLVYLEGKK